MPVWDRNAAIRQTIITRRREAQRSVAFKGLIASPQVLTGGLAPATSSTLALPQTGHVGVSYSVPITSGQLLVNVNNGRALGTPNLAANQIFRVGWLERGLLIDVELTAAVAGTATLYYMNEWKKPSAIATAVFT